MRRMKQVDVDVGDIVSNPRRNVHCVWILLEKDGTGLFWLCSDGQVAIRLRRELVEGYELDVH